MALACQLRAGAELVGLMSSDPVAWFEEGAADDLDSGEIDALLEQRNARPCGEKDFGEADRIRDQLAELGVVIEDGPDGPRWRRAGS